MNSPLTRAFAGQNMSGGHDASSSAHFRFTVPHLVLSILFSGLLCLPGCAKNVDSVQWKLGHEGEAMYYFLVQLESASTGDIDSFMEAGKKLLEINPSEASFQEIANFSIRQGQLEEARAMVRKGLAVFPASLPLTLTLSDTYVQQGKIAEAADTLLSYMKANPENQDALQELARVYLVGERYKDFDDLLKTVSASKMTTYLHYVKARSLLNRNQLAEGEKELRHVVREDPDMIDAWVNLGIALQLQEKHATSFPIFRKAVDADPENPGLWLRLIDAQLRGNRPDLAIRTMAEAPANPIFHMEAAMLFVQAKQYHQARKIFLDVRDTPGAPEEVHIYLAALAMENLNDPSEALRELTAIHPKSPLAEKALRWRLQILENTGRINESPPLAKEFAEQNSDRVEFQIIYAQALRAAGDTPASIAILRKAQKKWPESYSVALHLGSYLDPEKNKQEAMELMEFVIQKQPRNASALNYVGYMLAEDNKDLERAYDLISRATTESPEDPHIADSLAWVLYRLGKYNEAWEAICKSIRLGADHPAIWEHYGDIALKIGNVAEARKGYTNALKTQPDDPESIRKKIEELP